MHFERNMMGRRRVWLFVQSTQFGILRDSRVRKTEGLSPGFSLGSPRRRPLVRLHDTPQVTLTFDMAEGLAHRADIVERRVDYLVSA